MKIQIFQRGKKQFYFRVVARNGQIIAQSEAYTTKQSAKKTIASLKKSLRDASVDDFC